MPENFRVAIVAPEAAFVFDSWLASEAGARDESDHPSGAHLATWSFVRFLATHYDCDLLALGTRPRCDTWEGRPVAVGDARTLQNVNKTYAAAVAVDCCEDVVGLALALGCAKTYAYCHVFSELRLPGAPLYLGAALRAPGAAPAKLAACHVLVPSRAAFDYVRRFAGPAQKCTVATPADFGAFDPPPERHDLFDGGHAYVTFISPCPAKGMAVFVALARLMPDVRFAAVATRWTSPEIEHLLRSMANVDVFPAHEDCDAVYAATRVLLAPSLLPETFGLVAFEASLRGVPCLSSDAGGLPEANPAPDLVVATRLVWDVASSTNSWTMTPSRA